MSRLRLDVSLQSRWSLDDGTAVLQNVPDSRVVYTDNDPLVLAHARALLTSLASGADRVHRGGPERAGEDPRRPGGVGVQARPAEEFGRGLELVDPGVVLVSEWRPEEAGPRPKPEEVNGYGAVGRKPTVAS